MTTSEKDYSAEPLLAWFIDEQIEEEESTGKIAEELEMIEDGKSALLMLDRELGTRAYPPGSPLDPAAYRVKNRISLNRLPLLFVLTGIWIKVIITISFGVPV